MRGGNQSTCYGAITSLTPKQGDDMDTETIEAMAREIDAKGFLPLWGCHKDSLHGLLDLGYELAFYDDMEYPESAQVKDDGDGLTDWR